MSVSELLVLTPLASGHLREDQSLSIEMMETAFTVPKDKLWHGDKYVAKVGGTVIIPDGGTNVLGYAHFIARRLSAVSMVLARSRNAMGFTFDDSAVDDDLRRVALVRKIMKALLEKKPIVANAEDGAYILPYVVNERLAKLLSHDCELSPYHTTAKKVASGQYEDEVRLSALCRYYAQAHVGGIEVFRNLDAARFVLFCLYNIQYHLLKVLNVKEAVKGRLDQFLGELSAPAYSLDKKAITPLSSENEIAAAVVESILKDPLPTSRSLKNEALGAIVKI